MNKQKLIFYLSIISLVLLSWISPAGAHSVSGNAESSTDERNLSIRIYSPEENGVSYQDVAGMPIVVLGEVDAINGIQNITISDGTFTVSCKDDSQKKPSHANIICEVPRNYNVSEGKNQYVISVFDDQNEKFAITRHFTIISGIPPRDYFNNECSAHGKVTDTTGNSVSHATLIFEVTDIIVWGPEINDFRPYLRTTGTDADGAYDTRFGDCREHNHQNVTILKEGYREYFQQLTMSGTSNEVNFVLTPVNATSGQKTPGFDLLPGISSLILGLMLVNFMRKE